MERKSSKEYSVLSCLFGGRQKAEVTKFAFDDFIFVKLLVLLRTRSAQRLRSQYFAAVPTSEI